ncbi:hypothetical protein Pint_24407 [Pistacia integerrima]|uniref:Uncharacterized protein n=1 Tax=Pistacia integerrima TaxID=434235 RepID=A0ACC0YBB1_9ROSI|nr:hypothetical protein Pint_24407 [Pistacia integerrima]
MTIMRSMKRQLRFLKLSGWKRRMRHYLQLMVLSQVSNLEGMSFQFHLVDSTSTEVAYRSLLHMQEGSLSNGTEVHAGVDKVYVRFKLGLVRSGHLYMYGYRLVQCLLWLKSCQRRDVLEGVVVVGAVLSLQFVLGCNSRFYDSAFVFLTGG